MKQVFSLMMISLLSGCSMMGVYEGGFDCPPGQGVGCKPISEVNNMVNAGKIPPQDSSDKKEVSEETSGQKCTTCKVKTSGAGGDEDIWWAEPLWLESALPRHLGEATLC